MEIEQTFEITDAAVWQYFKNLREPYLQFRRYIEVEGAYVYYMCHYLYGRIELRKTGNKSCELTIIEPVPDDFDSMSPEQLADRKMINTDGKPIIYSPEERLNNIKVYEKAILDKHEMRSRHTEVVNKLINQGWFIQDQAEQQQSVSVDEDVDEKTILETQKSKVLAIIPNHLWDWTAVTMWYDMNSHAEIGKICGVSAAAVRNRLSELRRYYPKAKIFTHEQRQKALHDQMRKTHDTG
jgi:hypothetical protein